MSEAEVWAPGAHVDLDALKHEYDTVVFTVAAVRRIEHAMRSLKDLMEIVAFKEKDLSDRAEKAIEDAELVCMRLREVL